VSDQATVFISYSLTKAFDQRVVATLVSELKIAIKRNGLIFLDPLEIPGTQSIRAKVSQYLFESDALFAEMTTTPPNVLFETGFHDAYRAPIVYFINTEAYTNPDERLRSYLSFLGLDHSARLPADIGDIEYFPYPSDLNSTTHKHDFHERIDTIISSLKQRQLSIPSRRIRQQIKILAKRSSELTEYHRHNNPILYFASGLLDYITKEIDTDGLNRFILESSYYERCLNQISQSQHPGKVFAIADFTAGIETFWTKVEPKRAKVDERIFLINWLDFYDDPRLAEVTDIVVKHALTYNVRLGCSSHAKEHYINQFGYSGVGQDIMLIEPDLVGGYAKRDDRVCLRVDADLDLFQQRRELYEKIRLKTIEVNSSWSSHDILRAWIKFNEIGTWKEEWVDGYTRSPDYYRNYDKHIRVWIPCYTSCIQTTADIVFNYICSRVPQNMLQDEFTIFEIGYGTGALMTLLMERFSRADVLDTEELRAFRYIGIDPASMMQDLAAKKAKYVSVPIGIDLAMGSYPDAIPADIQDMLPADVICGSFVFHYLIESEDISEDGYRELFAKLFEHLREGGVLVFANCFFEETAKERENQIRFWRRGMERFISIDLAESFLQHNTEMTSCISFEAFASYAYEAGFSEVKRQYIHKKHSPFQVITAVKS